MDRLLLSLVFVLGMLWGPAQAAERILTGDQTGAYYNDIGPKVHDVLEANLFRDYTLEPAQGSGGNFEAIVADAATVGLAQADVFALLDRARPNLVASVLTRVRECAFAVTKNAGLAGRAPGEGWGNLMAASSRLRVALPNEKSGAAMTWRYIQSFNPKLAQVPPPKHFPSTMAAIEAVAKGEADIAFFVQLPDVNNAVFLRAKALGLHWIGVGDRQMLEQTVASWSGPRQRVYFVDTVPVASTWFGLGAPLTVQTACTKVVVMTGNPARYYQGTDQQRRQHELLEALKNAPQDAFDPESASYRTAVSQTSSFTGPELEGMLSSAERAAEQSPSQAERILGGER